MEEIIIREIKSEDYKSIASFHANYPEEEKTFEQWMARIKYWWDENPAYHEGHPRGVVALLQNKVIGLTSNIPTRMVLDGKEILVINGSSWRVLATYRKYSMDIWDKHRELTKDFILFNTTAIPQVVKLLKYLKFTEYQVADKWYYYFGASSFIQKDLKLRLLGKLQKLYIHLKGLGFLLNKDKIRISELATDEEINTLWNMTKNKYSFTNVRDSAYLKWIGKTKQILYIYKSNILVGFVILNFSERKKIISLTDFWGDHIHTHFHIIMKYILVNNLSCNIVIPNYTKNIENIAKKNMLIKRKIDKKAYLKCPVQNKIDFETSKLCLLQGDYGL